jgi:hypothetical protein
MKKLVLVVLSLGIIITIYFIVSAAIDGYCIWGKNDYEVTGQFGDFIGGVVGTLFSLAGTLLIYLTFKEQLKFNNEQKDFNKQQLDFNNFQQIEKEKDRMREIIKQLTHLSDNFCYNDIKGLEKIKRLEKEASIKQDDFLDIYNYLVNFTELCLLAYEINQKADYSEEEKTSFNLMVWRYSKNAACFWLSCEYQKYTVQSTYNVFNHFENPIKDYTEKLKSNFKNI